MKLTILISLVVFSLLACSSGHNNVKPLGHDYCGNILSATGSLSPHISARKESGTWQYVVPISLTRNNTCNTDACFTGSFTVNGTRIDAIMKYGGSLGSNNIQVNYSYLGRKATGSGKCTGSEIVYNYIFTEGPPKGSKGVAKIYLK